MAVSIKFLDTLDHGAYRYMRDYFRPKMLVSNELSIAQTPNPQDARSPHHNCKSEVENLITEWNPFSLKVIDRFTGRRSQAIRKLEAATQLRILAGMRDLPGSMKISVAITEEEFVLLDVRRGTSGGWIPGPLGVELHYAVKVLSRA